MSGGRRRPLISGNWKMNFDHFEAIHAARDLGLRLSPADVVKVDVSVHPPFTDIRSVQTVIEAEGVPVALGAQNCAVEDSGAYTGEVSPRMLAKLHVDYVIVGHSERRRYFCESDELVAAKLRAVFRNGMTPIGCVGESEVEREEGMTKDRLATQVEAALGGLAPESVGGMVIAYEPIWAIGTGQAATSEDAQEACSWIREIVARVAGTEPAATVRIQYGGSVTAENTGELLSCPDIDGVLVGGASLDATAFVGIIRAAANATR
ncbi:MAG TPA: triose-phosphate isomerase [Acidimicrobiales bacterium]|nr:triose-phosphate isomerase [Acidimicrobiales bacterium]